MKGVQNVTFQGVNDDAPEDVQNVTSEVVQNVTSEVEQNVTLEVVQDDATEDEPNVSGLVQNINMQVVRNVNISHGQTTNLQTVVLQLDGTAVDLGDYRYIEQCDDTTTILHRELPRKYCSLVS